MTETVWKYEIDLRRPTVLTLRWGYRILSFGQDPDGTTCVWVQLDPARPNAHAEVVLVGTGHEVPAKSRFVGTHICSGQLSGLVLHAYELT